MRNIRKEQTAARLLSKSQSPNPSESKTDSAGFLSARQPAGLPRRLRRFHALLNCTVAAGLSLSLGSPRPAGAQGQGQDNSAEHAVYNNPHLFNQLSGAARGRAERKYGLKHRRDPKQEREEEREGPDTTQYSDGLSPSPLSSGALSPLANPLVNDPTTDTTSQDTQSETTLALIGASIVVAGFNDSASYNPNNNSFRFTGFSQSTNSGSSWIDRGVLPFNSDGDAGDPVLAYSVRSGTLMYATLSFNTSYKLLIFRSTDNGATFTGPANGTPGFNSSTGVHDKEWLTVDNFPGSGQGNAYLFWRNFGNPGGMTLTRSTDDGLTWGPSGGTVLLTGSGQGAQVVVGPDHSVYCFWYDTSLSTARIVMRKSTDFGVTFGSTVAVTTLIGNGVNGDLGLGGFRSSSFPQAVVNAVSGNLYIIYPDVTAVSGGDRGEIYFRQSSNGGTTWSAAVRVNDDTSTRAQFQPGIAVKPDGSALAVGWYDRRRDPGDALIERWSVVGNISGNTVTFGPNFRVSQQFAPVFGVDPVVNTTYMGDYDQIIADNTYFYTTWGDNRDQSIGAPSRKNANVRFAKFTTAGPGAIVDVESRTVSGGNGNALIDPNECNDLQIVLRNFGSAAATNISATLSTTNAGVTIIQPNSVFPTVAPGALATNLTNFKINTSPSFACGTPINLTLTLSYNGESSPVSVAAPVSGVGYVMTQSSGASIVPGTTDIGNHADDLTTTISLPFSFTYYGQNYVTAALSSNGNIQFGTTSGAYANDCLPTTSFTDAILVHWDDLRTDGSVGVPQCIFTSISGVAPNRIFNIEWRASYYTGGANGNPLNFELRLYEGQSRMDMIYGVLNGTGSSATVGLQHGSTVTQFECNSGGLSAGLQLSFQLAACQTGGGQCQTVTLANFIANPLSGFAPLTTYFTNLSLAATNYSWDFGDGHTSTNANPSNTYSNAGNYTVSLTAIGPPGTNMLIRTNYIQATIPILPFITTQPVDQSSFGGSPVTFTVAADGTPPLSYQWRHAQSNITGATSTSLTIASPTVSDTGFYSVRVSSPYGSTNSANAALGIVPITGVGDNSLNQLNTPPGASGAIAIAAGAWHDLALRKDCQVVAWGNDGTGQTDVPSDLAGAAAIAAGGYHSLALRVDQSVVGWGANYDGQATPPEKLQHVIAIAAGTWHSLALQDDGTVVAWGDNSYGQTNVPPDLAGVTAIAAGGNHSLALKSDGIVVAWGENTDAQGTFVGQSIVPPDLSGVVAIAAGDYHSLAVKSNGTVIAWGDNSQGQSSPDPQLSGVVAVAGGGSHSLALKADGTAAAWGNNLNGQCNISSTLSNIVAIAAGSSHSLILLGNIQAGPQILHPILLGDQFQVLVTTLPGKSYSLQYKTDVDGTNWTSLPAIRGIGGLQFLTDPDAGGPQRFYRVRQF